MAAVEEQHAAAGAEMEEEDKEPTAAEKAQMELRKRIMKIMMDTSLSDAEKARRRQDLMSGKWTDDDTPAAAEGSKKQAAKKAADANRKPDLLEDTLKCVICFNLCERPVTGPCQHNFCLACFKRWLGQGKKTCPTCRAGFPAKFCENPRINTLLTYAIRCAKQGIKNDEAKTYNRIADESRPAEAFTTERAVRNGRANAASGRIMVNVPNDHFGPILPEHDPVNSKGVQVGDWWKDRLDCRQWGAHFPHVAGIAGQSTRGAQSVVLSGGYEDDHDEGEWFLYTGSGGRDLSGNKRTNKTQSFDQTFDSMNAALKLSCIKGLPVRVVRSFKEKRSSYAPSTETPVRYDGIYRILRCWRKKGAQGFLMCRYLFVRCDNAPAPWTSDESGDSPRLEIPELAAKEIKAAAGQVFAMSEKPFWDFDASKEEWCWARDAPPSQKAGGGDAAKKLKKKASAHERLLRDFSCSLCKGVLQNPLSMPCGHNFCKGCLDRRFAEAEAAQHQGSKALADAKPARSLRVRKVPKPCPTCKTDLADCLNQAAVNTEMAELIRRLQDAAEEARRQAAEEVAEEEAAAEGGDGAGSSKAAAAAAAGGADSDEDAEGEEEEEDDEQQQSEDEAGGDDDEQEAGTSSKQPPKKRQRVAAGSSRQAAEDTAAAAAAEGTAAAAAEAEEAAAPQGGHAAAAAAAPEQQGAAASRYAVEVSQLSEAFPEFEAELIGGLLEDQGGDVEEVHAYLKRMKRQLAQANRAPSKAAAGGGSSSKAKATGKGKGKGRGKKGAAKAAAAEDGSDEEQEEQQQPEEEEGVGEEAKEELQKPGQAADSEAAEAADASADAEPTDTHPGSDTDVARKQPGAGKRSAAAAAAEGCGTADGEAAGASKSKKRRTTAGGEGSKAKKRSA